MSTPQEKALAREYSRRYREKNRQKIRERNRARYWSDPDKYRAKTIRWIRENPEKVREMNRRAIESGRNRIKLAAQRAHPIPQTCETPGCSVLGERHHDNYDEPTAIRWLCRVHHMAQHRKDGDHDYASSSV